MEHFILETNNLCKKFGKQEAVKQISLQVPDKGIYGLLGANGAGKSTTLKMLTGMLQPTNGEIYFQDKKFQRKALWKIGAMIEEAGIYPNLSARENLKVRTKLLGLKEDRIDEVLEIVNLTDTGRKKAECFSTGMRQRLGIAAALLNHPTLLILDEPTNGLDPFGIEELRNLICTMPDKGITVIVSSHILSEISQMATHIGMISEGSLVYQKPYQSGEDLEELFMHTVKQSGRTRDREA